MILDVVHWADRENGCSRCAKVVERYVAPYFARAKRLCPACCTELSKFYDDVGWPPVR